MSATLISPSDIARETLRQLAARRLAPTPDHYAQVYRELSGLRKAGELASEHDVAMFLREQLAKVISDAVVPRLGFNEELIREAQGLATAVRSATDLESLREWAGALRRFWIKLELRGETHADLLASALSLLQLTVRNFGALSVDDQWLQPQLAKIEAILSGEPALRTMQQAERGLREVIYRQGALQEKLVEAKAAVRTMVAVFIDRLGTLSTTTGAYSERIGEYARKIEEAGDLASLTGVVARMMADTRAVQSDMLRSHDELKQARERAQEQEARVEALELELAKVAGLVREDMLTGALNRRGLEEAYAAELARAERREAPLALAVLDVDNFKALNDRLGHQAGDAALEHLSRTVRTALRPSDIVARFGGEEFVILLPDTGLEEAVQVMHRVQRALTKRFFLHKNERVLITFSAGVAQRREGETREVLIERADRAMYAAKRAGRNRVVATD